MKKIFFILLITCSSPALCRLQAQDYHFTQSYANPLRLNPAMMGANSDMKFMLDYRNQWSSIQKGFSTFSFTGLYPLYMKSGGKLDIGLSAVNDQAGAFKTTDAAIAIDYSKEIAADQNLCLSLMGGFVQKSLDAASLTFEDQYVLGSYSSSNPSNELILNNRVSYADVGFGFVWYMNPSKDKSKINAYAGISGYHMNSPNESFTGTKGTLPPLMTYIAGIKIFGENKIDVTPNIRMSTQAANVDMAAGVTLDYNLNDNMKIVFGTWYRRNDALAFLAGFEHKMFIFGYSYDAVTSSVNNISGRAAAHEITICYKLHKGGRKASASSFGGASEKTGDSSAGEKQNPFPSF